MIIRMRGQTKDLTGMANIEYCDDSTCVKIVHTKNIRGIYTSIHL